MSDITDYKQSFYTLLLWRVASRYIGERLTTHAPWRVGSFVCATDSKMLVCIHSNHCNLPRFDDKVQGPRKFAPIESVISRLPLENCPRWKQLPEVTLSFSHDAICLSDPDVLERDDFCPFQLEPGWRVDSGKLYWLSLIPGVQYQTDVNGSHRLVYFRWADGFAALAPLAEEKSSDE